MMILLNGDFVVWTADYFRLKTPFCLYKYNNALSYTYDIIPHRNQFAYYFFYPDNIWQKCCLYQNTCPFNGRILSNLTTQLAVNNTAVGLKIVQNQAIGRVLHRNNFFFLALKTKNSIKAAKTIMQI